MHVMMNDVGVYLRGVNTTAGEASSWASSAGSTADFLTGHIDRFKLQRRYRSATLMIPMSLVLGTGARAEVKARLQHADGSTGPWTDVPGAKPGGGSSESEVTQIIGNSVTSVAGPTKAVAQFSFNASGAKRYIRGAWQLNLASVTSSGQSMVTGDPLFVMAGAEELPNDSLLVPTSST